MFGVNLIALVPLSSFLAYAALVVVALRHPRERERRAFTLYLGLAGFWSFLSFIIRLDNSFVQDHVLVINKILMISVLGMILGYYHFVQVFVHRRSRMVLYSSGVFIVAMTILAAMGFIPRGASSDGGLLVVDFGLSLYLFVPYGVLMSGGAGLLLLQHRRETISHLARVRINYLLIGLVVVTLATATNVFNTLSVYPIDHAANLFNALIISYAILKYHLLDIRLVVRRGLTYSILTATLTAIYLLLLQGIQETFHGFTYYPGFVFAAGSAILLAAIFAPLRNVLQDRVDRLFFPGSYELRRMMASFRTNLLYTMNLNRLADDTLHAVISGLDAEHAWLLVPDSTTGDFCARFARQQEGEDDWPELLIIAGSPLIGLLTREAQVIKVDLLETFPEARGLHAKEKDTLSIQRVSLLCPMVSRGVLVGILALGKKKAGVDYITEEIDALLTMASGAALALDNAAVMDNLRDQQRRTEQLLAQVVHAQEQEREWIALELHDSVAQELVRASYQTQICAALITEKNGLVVQAELTSLGNAVEESIRELRRVLAGLRPPAIDELGLCHALKEATEGLAQANILPNFETSGLPIRLEPSMEISIYRIVQEALNNIRRHAQASRVDVRLQFQKDHLSIEITDDGKGFNVTKTLQSSAADSRMGLTGIKQRAEWLGGSLLLESNESSGTNVVVRLPLSYATSTEINDSL